MTNATASISGRNDNPPLLLYGGVGFDEVRQLADDQCHGYQLNQKSLEVIWTPHSR